MNKPKNFFSRRTFCKFFGATAAIFAMSSAHAQQTPVSELSFADDGLRTCVERQNVEFVEQIRSLFCYNIPIVNLQGISQLTEVSVVYLYGGENDTLQGVEHLNDIPTLRQLSLHNYRNDIASLEVLDPEKLWLSTLDFSDMPNIGDEVYDFLQRWESLYGFGLINVPVTRAPNITNFPNIKSIVLRRLNDADLNAFASRLANTQLAALSLGGQSSEPIEFDFEQWNLPASLEDLQLNDGYTGSMSAFNDMLVRSDAAIEYLELNIDSQDWQPMSELSNIAPNIYAINVSGTDFDQFSVLEGFTKLDYVYASATQAIDADALVSVINNNPNLYLLSLGGVGAFYCDDIEALEAYPNIVDLNYRSCRTAERRFRIIPPVGSENAQIVDVETPYLPPQARAELTDKPLEIDLNTSPYYSGDEIRSVSVDVHFNDGTELWYSLAFDQASIEPVAFSDINFADSELARCVEDMATLNFNVNSNAGEPIEYAHEFTYMLCDAPSYKVTNLTGLEHFTELRYVQMFGEGEQIRDLSPIKPLKKLEWLTLMDKGINDAAASPLKDYRGFSFYWQNINLNENKLSDPSLFDYWFANYRPGNVYIADNQYESIPNGFVSEKFSGNLYLSGNPIVNLQSELDRLDVNSTVYSLALNDMGIGALGTLKLPSSLASVDLDSNGLTTLDSIVFPDTIARVSVANNPLSSIESLYGYEDLYEVDLSNTQITDINSLKMIPSLEYAMLNENEVRSIEGIASFDREVGNPFSLSINRTPLRDYQPAVNLPWLTLSSLGNAHVSCSEFEKVQSSSTIISYDVCLNEDGTIRYQGEYSDLALADNSKRFGRLIATEDGFSFIPHPGQEGWIEIQLVLTDANGFSYTVTIRVYVEPGTNPAIDSGIPIVILVSGDDTEE